MILGPSRCRKTYFEKNILENCEHVMDAVLENMVWIYISFEPMFADLQKINKKLHISFEGENLFPPNLKHLIILDDIIFLRF